MRHPDRRQTQRVRETFVRQRTADVRQDRRPRAGRAGDRLCRPAYPWMIRVQTRCVKESFFGLGDFHILESMRIEMTPQYGDEIFRLCSGHKTDLTVRRRAAGDGIDWILRVARPECEHLKGMSRVEFLRP